MSQSKIFSLKNTFKVTLQYLFNVYRLYSTVSYFKLKVDQKMCTFKNLEEILKIKKKSGNSVLSTVFNLELSIKLKVNLKEYTYKNLENISQKNMATL